MEDIQEEDVQEFKDEAPAAKNNFLEQTGGADKFLDDSFGTNLEFSRLIQNHGQFEQIIEDKYDIDMTETLLLDL